MKGLLVAASLLWAFAVRAETLPAAISVDPSQSWDGNDGTWSSFPIRVGTPAQDLRVFISTIATSTWVVQAPLGCEGWEGSQNCAQARGGNFTNATSSTWKDKAYYDLFVEQNLGYNDGGEYGFDVVGLGWQGTGVTLNSSTITMITTQNWIVGEMGLNPRPTNFTNFNDRATSLLSLLYEQNSIPSLSYSYNAGAKYRLNAVLGSLTLGGYDDSLYDPTQNLTAGFDSDQTRDLTVGLQAITSATSSGNTSLLPTSGLYLIDSTVSQNYLAQDACEAFEKAFGLELNEEYGLYILNRSQHTKLAALNPNITFTLGALASGGPTIDITFPYAAFDLNVSYPYNESYYFPIVPATNSTQYTLGRQFLQEAVITVDYSRGNFSVFPRTWSLDATKHIVSILPPNTTDSSTTSPSATGTGSSTNEKKSSGIGTGAIVGIVIGVIAIAVIIGGALFWRRHKKRKEDERIAAEVAAAVSEPKDPPLPPDPYADAASPGITELDSPEVKPPELHAEHYFSGAEMDSSQVVPTAEMEGDRVFYELEAPHGMHELPLQRPQQRQASDASTPTWKSRSPIRHPSDGG